MSGSFDEHHCIVFECCSLNLYQIILGEGGLRPLPRRHVAEMAYQIIEAIECTCNSFGRLRSTHRCVVDLHSVGLIHGDIKPNNIALRNGTAALARCFHPGRGFRESVRPFRQNVM